METYRELIRKEAEKRWPLTETSIEKYGVHHFMHFIEENSENQTKQNEAIDVCLWLLAELNIDPDSVKGGKEK